MTESLGPLTVIKYSPALLFDTWKRHLSGRVSVAEVCRILDLYVTPKAKKRTFVKGNPGSLQADEAVQKARIRVWEAVKRKRLPDTCVRSLHAYLISIIYSEVDAYPYHNQQEFPAEVMHGMARRANPPLDEEMLLGDLPDKLRKEVGPLILDRFPEVSPGATKYVLDRVLNNEYLSEGWLKRQYNIQEPRFFLESVMIAVRMTLYNMREDVYPLSSSLSETLYGSFCEEYAL